jgi:hypothetical protein
MSSKHYQLSAMGFLIVGLVVGVFVFLRTGPTPEETPTYDLNYTPNTPVTESAPEPNQGATLFIPAGQWPTISVQEPNETDNVNEG